MLHFILGKAKSGKTGFIHEKIAERAKDNLKTYLVVPDQATFQNEKRLCTILPKNSYNTSVIGFSRLTEAVFNLYGKPSKKMGGDVEKLLIMSSAAQSLSDDLVFYKKYPSSTPFLEELIALYDEMSNSGTSPSDLASFSFKQDDKILKAKTYELSLILDLYHEFYSKYYITNAEVFSFCADLINKNSPYFFDFNIFVDDFIDFTHPQRLVLEALISSCSDVYISFEIGNKNDDAFMSSLSEMRRLIEFCKKSDIPYEEITMEKSFMADGLKALEDASSRLYLKGNETPCENLYVCMSKNPTEELECCASLIKKLVREEKMRYKDFAVFTSDFQMYSSLMENVFKRYDIPFFSDELSSKDYSPLAGGIITAVKTACRIKDYDLTDLAFSPITGIDPAEAGDFTNYCYVWSLSLKSQLSEFKNNPEGIKETFSESEKEKLSKIEETRKTLAEPVINLRKAFSKGSLEEAAKGIFKYLEECDAVQNIMKLSEKLDEAEREEFLSQQNQVWEALCDILDLFTNMSSSVKVSLSQLADLVSMSVSSIKTATIPRSLDLVDIGSPKRMRADEPKAVFILGTSMGNFPQSEKQNRILNDRDRGLMIETGLLMTDLNSADLLERAVCYRCLTEASRYVFVSVCKTDSKGEEIVPSAVFTMCRNLSAHKMITPDNLFLIESTLSLKDQLAKKSKDNDSISQSIKEVSEEILDVGTIENIKNAKDEITHRIENKNISLGLFGKDMSLSPSQVECFYNCQYKYFLKYGLRLKPVMKAQLDSLQTGTLIHHLLEFILKKYGSRIDDSMLCKIKEDLLSETENYIEKRIADPSSLLPSQKHSFKNVALWVFELLQYLIKELNQSEFTPAFFEMPIRKGQNVEPVVLKTKEGTASVEGIVDRVDKASIDGENFVRIIDYKSGAKVFKLGDVMNGLNMQMLIYLFSIWENGKTSMGNPVPAGILYQPALGKFVTSERENIEKADSLHKKDYKMNGLLLNDEKVLSAMDKNLNGEFIPYKGAKDKGEWVFSLEELTLLKRLVEKKITSMADSLDYGEICDLPSKTGGTTHCRYCEYFPICSHREDGKAKEIENIKKEEFLKEAKEDVGD